MAGTYSQLHIQVVFAVKGRGNLLLEPWRVEIFKYMSGIITGKNQKPIIVNGVADHVHLFIGMQPAMRLSDLVRDIKIGTSKFINDKKYVKGKFTWQGGFGAFSYSHSQLDNVYQYISNQKEHHHKKTFKEEYLEMLRKFEIEHDERYLFEWIE